MDVLASRERRDLGASLAKALGGRAHAYEGRIFPDGERYVRVESPLSGVAAVVVDGRPNDLLVEGLLACDAAREAGATRVVACLPYFAYGRQDRRFKDFEAISVRPVLRALASVADGLVTVDAHKPEALSFFGEAAVDDTAGPEIAQALRSRRVDLVLAPDAGARDRGKRVANELGCRFDHLEKTRVSDSEVRMAPKEVSAKGHVVGIVDDIISTGGTMATATRQLLAAGATRVVVAATHGLFVSGAEKRLEEAGVAEVLVTDTVPTPRSVISCANALARGAMLLQAP